MVDSQAIRTYMSATAASSGAIIITLLVAVAVNFLLGGILAKLVGMINSMQLIVHLPIFNV